MSVLSHNQGFCRGHKNTYCVCTIPQPWRNPTKTLARQGFCRGHNNIYCVCTIPQPGFLQRAQHILRLYYPTTRVSVEGTTTHTVSTTRVSVEGRIHTASVLSRNQGLCRGHNTYRVCTIPQPWRKPTKTLTRCTQVTDLRIEQSLRNKHLHLLIHSSLNRLCQAREQLKTCRRLRTSVLLYLL